jgi:hypothetical protein
MRPFEVSSASAKQALQEASLQRIEVKDKVLKDNLNVYPNPFASNTTINFEVAAKSKVSIKIYNIEGRELSTVFEGEKSPGIYNIPFKGSRLSAGVYICRVQVNNQLLQRRLIIQ